MFQLNCVPNTYKSHYPSIEKINEIKQLIFKNQINQSNVRLIFDILVQEIALSSFPEFNKVISDIYLMSKFQEAKNNKSELNKLQSFINYFLSHKETSEELIKDYIEIIVKYRSTNLLDSLFYLTNYDPIYMAEALHIAYEFDKKSPTGEFTDIIGFILNCFESEYPEKNNDSDDNQEQKKLYYTEKLKEIVDDSFNNINVEILNSSDIMMAVNPIPQMLQRANLERLEFLLTLNNISVLKSISYENILTTANNELYNVIKILHRKNAINDKAVNNLLLSIMKNYDLAKSRSKLIMIDFLLIYCTNFDLQDHDRKSIRDYARMADNDTSALGKEFSNKVKLLDLIDEIEKNQGIIQYCLNNNVCFNEFTSEQTEAFRNKLALVNTIFRCFSSEVTNRNRFYIKKNKEKLVSFIYTVLSIDELRDILIDHCALAGHLFKYSIDTKTYFKSFVKVINEVELEASRKESELKNDLELKKNQFCQSPRNLTSEDYQLSIHLMAKIIPQLEYNLKISRPIVSQFKAMSDHLKKTEYDFSNMKNWDNLYENFIFFNDSETEKPRGFTKRVKSEKNKIMNNINEIYFC